MGCLPLRLAHHLLSASLLGSHVSPSAPFVLGVISAGIGPCHVLRACA